MSRERKRDNSTPSLFPFLAVLLCTMGALVLLLVLIVGRAQATAEKIVVEKKEHVAEVESQLQSTQIEFERQLAERRLDLEGKRLALQSLEKQIVELTEELKGVQRTSELLHQDISLDDSQLKETQRKISQLEQQLAQATDTLKNRLDNPVGNKPIFAIIPYEGTNGTHRRPVYLECTDKGVIIQPEGVVIDPTDLQPPYGPGNPLDAALRTVRAKYTGNNASLTSSAYPLLVVRPSGVRNYAMARQAIASWDDQFGYELIDEKLELAYPDGEPGLAVEIEQAIVAARQRQAALMMAMPRKYRQMINHSDDNEFVLSEGSSDQNGQWSGDGTGSSAGFGTPAGLAATGAPEVGNSGTGNSGTGASAAGGRGGFAQSGYQGNPSTNANFGAHAGYENTLSESNPSTAAGQRDGQRGGQGAGQNAGQGNSYFGGTGMAMAGDGNSGLAGNGTEVSGNSDDSWEVDRSARTYAGAGGASSTGNGSAQGRGNGTSTMNAPGYGRQGVGGSLAQGSAMPNFSGDSSDLSGSLDPTQPMQMQKMAGTNAQADSSESQSSGTYGASSTFSNNSNGNQNSKAVPVARSKGRNWAWSEGPPTKTAVLRSIRVVCYADRWVVMPENGSTSQQVSIPVGKNPQVGAEKLARTIADRVSDWGIALSGGYWKPELVVDVAPDAEHRYQQLTQLLDGSGLSLRRRTASR